jgi:signal transduction histidine kinase
MAAEPRSGFIQLQAERLGSYVRSQDSWQLTRRYTDQMSGSTLESLLAWALREGVTNVIRHAGATTATIRLRRADGRAELELTDDGRGAADFEPGNGLHGLRERVTERHGDVEFGRAAEGGFRLRVSVPL